MENRMDRAGLPSRDDSLPSSVKGELLLSSPPLQEQLNVFRKRHRKPLSGRKATLLSGLALTIILSAILAVHYLHTLPGRKKWSFHARGAISASPVVVNSVACVYTNPDYPDAFGTFRQGVLCAIDITSDTMKWSAPTGDGIFTSLTVANSVIYSIDFVLNGDGTLYALDATAFGTAKWSQPVVVAGIVYATSNADPIDDNLYALDAASGRQKYSQPVEGPMPYALMVVNGMVYVSSLNSVVSAFDAVRGREKRSCATRTVIQSAPIVVNGIVYVDISDETLYTIFP